MTLWCSCEAIGAVSGGWATVFRAGHSLETTGEP